MMNHRITVLGVPFDRVTLSEAVRRLDGACKKEAVFFCVTPNPEICLLAQKNTAYHSLLKSSQLSIADGFGILWAARFLSGNRSFIRWLGTLLTPFLTRKYSPLRERVTGTDLMQQFCKLHKDRKIFLLGASKRVNDTLAQQLKESGVNIVGNFSGDASEKLEASIRSMINASGAEVLFVAFGAPKQEKWQHRHLLK